MSRKELQALVDRSSLKDRLFLAAYLQHLATRDESAVKADLTAANREISRGKKTGLRQMKSVHRTLVKAGL